MKRLFQLTQKWMTYAAGVILWIAGTFFSETPARAVTLICAALLHECGHLLAFSFLKKKNPRLQTEKLGLRLYTDEELTVKEEFIIALSGPLANLLTAAFMCALTGPTEPVFLHLFTAFGNLMPVRTLDGGRLLACMLECRCDPNRSYRIQNAVSLTITVLGMLVALCALWVIGEGGYLFYMAFCLFIERFAERQVPKDPGKKERHGSPVRAKSAHS